MEVAIETEKRLSTLETEMMITRADIAEIKEMLATVVANINKMKGFWAGVVAAGTALGAALGALLSYIFHAKIG